MTPVRLADAGLDAFGETAAAAVQDGTVPGIVALLACHDQVHVETHGRLAFEGPPVRRDSLFRITSTSKPIVAAAVLALVDRGRLGLDDAIGRWLPELAEPRVLIRPDGPLDETVPAERPITVRHLLTFTYGFGMSMDMFLSRRPWPVQEAANALHLNTLAPPDADEPPDPDAWMAALGSLPLMAQPGRRWMYNTSGQVLSVLAARAGDAPLPDVLQELVLAPLGMRDTAFWTTEPERLATAYLPTPDGLVQWDAPSGRWSRPPRFPDPHSGLVSTADDLLAFARMLLARGDAVLSPGLVDEMTRDQLTPAQREGARGFLDFDVRSWGFGQSVVVTGERAGAFGWDGGSGVSWLVDPVRDLVVLVLTQRFFDSPSLPALHRDLQDAAYRTLPA